MLGRVSTLPLLGLVYAGPHELLVPLLQGIVKSQRHLCPLVGWRSGARRLLGLCALLSLWWRRLGGCCSLTGGGGRFGCCCLGFLFCFVESAPRP